MLKLLTASFCFMICLASLSAHAQPVENFDVAVDATADATVDELHADALDSDDHTILFRPTRPQPSTVYRCCAKPHSTYGVMNCSQGTDKILTWSSAIRRCENYYGKEACVSGCRKLPKAG